MNPACVVLYGLLCVSPEYREVAQVTGFLTEVNENGNPRVLAEEAIQRMGVRVDVFASDVIYYVPTSVMDKACNEFGCVYYRKHCDATENKCEFIAGALRTPPPLQLPPALIARFGSRDPRPALRPVRFEITYQTEEALIKAENSIQIAINGVADNSFVPVSLLEELSASVLVRGCRGLHGPNPTVMQGC